MGKDGQDSRGWSMVFDDRTEPTPVGEDTAPPKSPPTPSPEHTVAQRPPLEFDELDPAEATDAQLTPGVDVTVTESDPLTVVDAGLATELEAALAPAVLADTDPKIDERLANVIVELENDAAAGPEQTVRTLSPFAQHEQLVEVDTPLARPPPSLEHGETLLELEQPLEATRKTRIPFDLMDEQSLPPPPSKPPPARSAPIRPAKERDSRPPPVDLRPPMPDRNSGEHTAIDLAAALGMAPERSTAAPRPLVAEAPASKTPDPELRVPAKGVEPKFTLGLDADPASKPVKTPPRAREGLRADQLNSLAASTSNLAKIIPVILGIMVVLATLAISLQLFKREERQEHIELRFLAVGSNRPVTTKSTIGTPVIVETDPPGLLVMFDRQVLGKTPFVGEIPVDLEDRVAVELSSPYFERWLGEIARGPAGDYTIKVDLNRRR